MKMPALKSRARTILESLMQAPATVQQGIERHGKLNASEGFLRQLYDQLVLDECATRCDQVYSITVRASLKLAPAQPEQAGAVTAPAYRGDWRAPAMSGASARRFGSAYGFSRESNAAAHLTPSHSVGS
ncbi:hypothetical protein HSX11_01600 [Oxalobacteraceae bacterium]|nr:hypothetical protein [Oxalobacteraceae bacterium]